MRKVNLPLLAGSVIVLFFIAMAYFPEAFTSRDPLYEEHPKFIHYRQEGCWVESFAQNPMRPNRENIMGTDDAGRDIYARLVYGARNTLKLAFLVAAFRALLALPFGLAAGMGVSFFSRLIKLFNTFFSAVPMLVFSFIVLNIGYFYRMQIDRAILAFALVLTLVGWSRMAGMLEDATRRVMMEDFIEGEVAIGKTWSQIALQNVLPHIIPTGVGLLFKEMAMALFLIAQLAVLLVFVGTTREIKALAFRANYLMILEPEWGGMLSRVAVDVLRYEQVYWVTLFPVLTFSLAILGINLTGEGLRLEFQKRNSRVISNIRKTYFLISPWIYLHQVKQFRNYMGPVLIKTGTTFLILLYVFLPRNQSLYPFQINEAADHLEELVKRDYGGRVSGTAGGYAAGEYILEKLEGYGYQVSTTNLHYYQELQEGPDFLEGTARIFEPLSPMVVESGNITLWSPEGEERTFQLHKDFTLFTLNKDVLQEGAGGGFHYRGFAADQAHIAQIPLEETLFPIERGNMMNLLSGGHGAPFSQSNYHSPNIYTAHQGRGRAYDLQFLLLPGYEEPTNVYLHKAHVIIPFSDLRAELEEGFREVEVTFSYPRLPDHPGRILEAFLPGKGRTLEDPGELIILGATYDGIHLLGSQDSLPVMSAAPAASLLEVARVVAAVPEPLEKSVLLIFWDNEMERKKQSHLNGSYYYNLIEQRTISMIRQHGYYYFELGYPGFNSKGNLNLVTFPPQSGKKPTYQIGMEIERRLKQLKVPFRRYQSLNTPNQASADLGVHDYASPSLLAMRLNAYMSVGFGLPRIMGMGGEKDTLENLHLKRLHQMGQIMIDTLTMNPSLMEVRP